MYDFYSLRPQTNTMLIHSHLYEKTSRTYGTINANFRNPLKIFQPFPVNSQPYPHTQSSLLFLTRSFSYFSYSVKLRLRQGHNECRSLLRTSAVLICPSLRETWIRITALTITGSLSLRLRKLTYCK